MKATHIIIGISLVIVTALLIFAYQSSNSETASNYDDFAQCLTDAGAQFYGAFWCPHCQEQKAMFKDSENLPYTECSTPDGEDQTQICVDEKITSYPTWKFADGSTLSGTLALDRLAEKTNCQLP